MVDGSYYLGTTFVHIEVHKRRALPVIHSDRKSQQTAQKEENTNLQQQLFRGASLQVEFPLERGNIPACGMLQEGIRTGMDCSMFAFRIFRNLEQKHYLLSHSQTNLELWTYSRMSEDFS